MTGRQFLDKRISFLAVILVASLALWIYFLVAAEGAEATWQAMLTPVGGFLVGWSYHVFMIRCPRCHKPIGHLVRSPFEFSLFRFSKRVRFCPHCTIDFEDDLRSPSRERRRLRAQEE